jgi:hypothetical protein
MLDGASAYGPEYYRKRAREILKLAELSHFEDVRGFLAQIAQQYQLLADRIEAFAKNGVRAQSLADEIASRRMPPGDVKPD